MVFEYAQLKGDLNGMGYYGYHGAGGVLRKKKSIPYSGENPFVGKNFNVTRAGIHADGLLKNEEIYNIFDTEKF